MAAPPLPGSKRRRPLFLGRYELIGELARGGMGTVYLARRSGEAGFQRLFAIKVLHAHLESEAAFVDMLRDEARIAARLHHPNVVAIVDLGSHGRQHYVVMDYVEGPSFAALWKLSGAERPLAPMVSIIIDALDGLHAAHTLKDDDGRDLNLVHRDVSPQNILVGVDGIARITDFGIAKAEARIGSTRPGLLKGKLQFMSPEQVKDEAPIDRRTDVWAAGVVLWSLLTSEHLFRGKNQASTIHDILGKAILPPSETRAKPPAFFDPIVMKSLARDRDQRYSSALEMADALRRLAVENGLVRSRSDLKQWVEETFEEELERRRQSIRDVVRRRSGTPELDYSQVRAMPSRPPAPSSRALPDAEEEASRTPVTFEHSPNASEKDASSGSSSQPSAENLPPLESLETLDARELTTVRGTSKTFALGGLTAASVTILLAFLGARSKDDAVGPGTTSVQAAKVVASAAAPLAKTRPVVATREPASAPFNDDTLAADGPPVVASRAAPEQSATKAVRRVRNARPHSPPPGPTRPTFPAPKGTGTLRVPVAPKPAARTSDDDFESNPYLRR